MAITPIKPQISSATFLVSLENVSINDLTSQKSDEDNLCQSFVNLLQRSIYKYFDKI